MDVDDLLFFPFSFFVCFFLFSSYHLDVMIRKVILFFNFVLINSLYSNCSRPQNAVITIHGSYGQRKRELSD